MEFQKFPKMARFNRDIVVTEKIDGTNAQVLVLTEEEFQTTRTEKTEHFFFPVLDGSLYMAAGSRSRYLLPEKDNFEFAAWVVKNKDALALLGPGRHFGEWWGKGIQRNYGLKERRFSLFNTIRWVLPGTEPQPISQNNPKAPVRMQEVLPECCGLVPVLYNGIMSQSVISSMVLELRNYGSVASPGFMKPEGVVIYHKAANVGFKITCENDGVPKSLVK